MTSVAKNGGWNTSAVIASIVSTVRCCWFETANKGDSPRTDGKKFADAWHHVGHFGEPFTVQAFVFRWVSGLVFTAIFAWRGFAPAVWTHALSDHWVLVL